MIRRFGLTSAGQTWSNQWRFDLNTLHRSAMREERNHLKQAVQTVVREARARHGSRRESGVAHAAAGPATALARRRDLR